MKRCKRSLAVVPCAVYRLAPDAGPRFRWAVPDAALNLDSQLDHGPGRVEPVLAADRGGT